MSTRIQVLFLAAAAGVLVALGLLAASVGGWSGLGAYALVLLALVALVVRRARQQQRASLRTCDCCEGTQHDPVQVL